MNPIYHLGEYYTYPKGKRRFKLLRADGRIFEFECGHRVTDCVFVDLVRVKTGVQVYQEKQLSLID